MQWQNASAENPGRSVYFTDQGPRRYVIQRSRKVATFWRLFVRDTDSEPLRTIYVGQTLKECKAYAEEYDKL